MNLLEKGKLLIAEPSILGDYSFNRAVVLLTEFSENGSVGFIMNKPLEFSLNDLIPEINSELTIYNGGPVEQDNLYFVHIVPNKIMNSIEIAHGIYWGGDFETVKSLLNNNELSKNEIRFFLGYSGWACQQLEEEIKENSWVVSNNNFGNRILSQNNNDLWKNKISDLGGNYILFSNAPEDPILN